MTLLGLTGGIGMGKSACADMLRARGIPLVDTDDLARQVVAPGEPALEEIRQVFGEEFLDAEGCLRRKELGRRVFSDTAARQRLEQILHPQIRKLWLARVAQWRAESKSIAVVVIPLLFETRAEKEFDATICVACSAATQRERLLARGWSAEVIQRRNLAQWPVDQKLANSDYVIWTEGSLEVHAQQLERILKCLSGLARLTSPA
jgi:dephospho-CoA kinase